MPDTDQPTTAREKQCRAHPQPHSAHGCLRGRLTNTLPPGNTMRMPGNCGAVLITGIDTDPYGGMSGFVGQWQCRIDPTTAPEGSVLVQILAPSGEPDVPDRADVFLWFTRRKRWILLGKWKDAGPGWLHEAAPLMAAAVPARTASEVPSFCRRLDYLAPTRSGWMLPAS